MDFLKLLGTAVVFIAVVGVAMWWKNRRPDDDQIVAKVTTMAKDMCACRDMSCADDVARKFDKVADSKVARDKDGMSSAYSKARMQVQYMQQCYKYIAKGKTFTVETNEDGSIRFVRPDSMRNGGMQFDIGSALTTP